MAKKEDYINYNKNSSKVYLDSNDTNNVYREHIITNNTRMYFRSPNNLYKQSGLHKGQLFTWSGLLNVAISDGYGTVNKGEFLKSQKEARRRFTYDFLKKLLFVLGGILYDKERVLGSVNIETVYTVRLYNERSLNVEEMEVFKGLLIRINHAVQKEFCEKMLLYDLDFYVEKLFACFDRGLSIYEIYGTFRMLVYRRLTRLKDEAMIVGVNWGYLYEACLRPNLGLLKLNINLFRNEVFVLYKNYNSVMLITESDEAINERILGLVQCKNIDILSEIMGAGELSPDPLKLLIKEFYSLGLREIKEYVSIDSKEWGSMEGNSFYMPFSKETTERIMRKLHFLKNMIKDFEDNEDMRKSGHKFNIVQLLKYEDSKKNGDTE